MQDKVEGYFALAHWRDFECTSHLRATILTITSPQSFQHRLLSNCCHLLKEHWHFSIKV